MKYHVNARVFPKWMWGNSTEPDFWNYQTNLQIAVQTYTRQPEKMRQFRKLLCSKYIMRVRILPMTVGCITDAVLKGMIETAQNIHKRADYVWYRTPVCQVAMGLKALDLPVLLILIIASWTGEASNRMINDLPMDKSWVIAKLIKHKSFL